MYRFWTNYIEPIIKIIDPKIIVEIGAEQGHNTVNIVKYCAAHDIKCHSIDPGPIKRLKEVKSEFEKCGRYHQALSLDILPALEPADIYLIDGDHNWYTVFHELEQIRMLAEKNKHPLPLIFFHDVEWPYARRDMYYNPETIPAEYRRKHKKGAIARGKKELDSKSGFNMNLDNAISEGGERNGVLTAVEDFLKQNPDHYLFESVPGLHGLGVLIPKEFAAATIHALQKVIQIAPNTKKHIGIMENERLDYMVEAVRLRIYHEQLVKQQEGWRKKLEKENQRLQITINTQTNDLTFLNHQQDNLKLELADTIAKLNNIKEELNKIESSRAYRLVKSAWSAKNKFKTKQNRKA